MVGGARKSAVLASMGWLAPSCPSSWRGVGMGVAVVGRASLVLLHSKSLCLVCTVH